MSLRARVRALAALALALGCAAPYSAPTAGPLATVVANADSAPARDTGVEVASLVGSCDAAGALPARGRVPFARAKPTIGFLVPASQCVELRYAFADPQVQSRTCAPALRFVPRDRAEYVLRFERDRRSCHLTLVDRASGQPLAEASAAIAAVGAP